MTAKSISRFFSVKQAVYGAIILIIAIVWPVAHIVKGTMNTPGAIFSIAMLAVSIHLGRLAWIDLRNDFKKDPQINSK
ncbi:hypothetical protein [uncultured Duncaniella sp.]|uniref:hypothetical protein n=1 Tax=uncultured Duncaniella sp. TaxID=2768039 RepID=UPI0025A96A45|nr:hypothetical protein [uncultured Duncaniella sp.]